MAGQVLVSAAFALVEAADVALLAGGVVVGAEMDATEAPDVFVGTQAAPWGAVVPPGVIVRARVRTKITRAR
jgi:hypothetical protein